jgi:hypothetical protein
MDRLESELLGDFHVRERIIDIDAFFGMAPYSF